jgi:hypothetical protein
MPKVRNASRAKDVCDGRARRRGRCNNTFCSLFVLVALMVMGAYFEQAETTSCCGACVASVECPATSLSRASVPAAMVADPAGASSTLCCR